MKTKRTESPSAFAAALESRLFERPDGFYWQEEGGGRDYGPFATLADALADMDAGDASVDEDALEVAETLEEAESEVGIAGWIDPDSGELAEEQRPRIEDH